MNVPRKIVICLMFAALPAGAVSDFALEYDDLPKLVRERNMNVTGSSHIADAADERTGHLVRSYLPTLEAYGGAESFQMGPYSRKNQPYGGIEAKLNLFRGGRDLLEENVRGSQKIIAASAAKTTYAAELADTRKSYWTLVSMRETVQILNRALTQNEENLAVAKRRIARGLGTETDRLEFEIFRGQLHEEVESITHAMMLVEIKLTAQLGLDQGTRLKTDVAIKHVHDDAILVAPFDAGTHPDLVASRASEQGAASQRGQNYRWWTPSLDVYGGYFMYTLRDREYLTMSFRDDTVVGVRLSFQLFDGLQSKAEGSSYAKLAQGHGAQSSQQERNLVARAEISKENLKHDHELIHFSEERIIQGKKYLKQTLDEYVRGVKNSIDVLGAAQKSLGFEKQYAERRRDYQITKADLLTIFSR